MHVKVKQSQQDLTVADTMYSNPEKIEEDVDVPCLWSKKSKSLLVQSHLGRDFLCLKHLEFNPIKVINPTESWRGKKN